MFAAENDGILAQAGTGFFYKRGGTQTSRKEKSFYLLEKKMPG